MVGTGIALYLHENGIRVLKKKGEKRMESMSTRKAQILAIDAGGTMTDTFIIDDSGDFVVGKAQSTPEDESVGLLKLC